MNNPEDGIEPFEDAIRHGFKDEALKYFLEGDEQNAKKYAQLAKDIGLVRTLAYGALRVHRQDLARKARRSRSSIGRAADS